MLSLKDVFTINSPFSSVVVVAMMFCLGARIQIGPFLTLPPKKPLIRPLMDAPIPLFGGSGVYINGGTIGGLDLMAVFTKDFWNKTGRDNRARTLEVLRTYGDSTTVLINKPIEQIAR